MAAEKGALAEPSTMLVHMLTAVQGEMVKEGSTIDLECEHVVQVGFMERGTQQFSTKLLYCEEDRQPTRKTNGRSLCFAFIFEQC